MFEIQSPKVERMERQESENFKEIKPEGKITVEEARNFVDALFHGMEKNPKEVIAKEDNLKKEFSPVEQNWKVGERFDNLEVMKSQLDMSYKEIKEMKPMHSPNLAKWYEKGGKVEIGESDGKKIWVFENSEGVRDSYCVGLPDDRGESPSQIKDIDGAKCNYDDCGQLYRIGDKLVTNISYELNGYCFDTDGLARVVSVEGPLHMKDRDERLPIKDSIEVIGRGDQREGDDRGHLIGDQFDGPNGLENLVPQDAEINRKDFKNFENQLADEVKAGKDVYVKINVLYDGSSRRPTNIIVSYSIDGKKDARVFPNGPREV